MTDQVAQLEAQLRHLTLPSQRGYRRQIEKRLSDADQAVVEALRYAGRPDPGKKKKPIEPWLYAAASKFDFRKADLDRWFVTGPKDRRGYICGPFSRSQVDRIAASGLLSPVCCEDGHPVAYRLKSRMTGDPS